MKATEQYFPVVLFIMLYKLVAPFESVDEIIRVCEYSNESHWAFVYFYLFYYFDGQEDRAELLLSINQPLLP